MKHLLLSIFLLGFAYIAQAQSSMSERLAYRTSSAQDRDNINIFPNPATTHIGLSESTNVTRIVLYNMVGREMKNFEALGGDSRYFVGDLPRGIYLVQILGQNSEVITTRRVSIR
jgi:hypothetical protein